MTILFLEDWQKYPQAIVDTNTSNKSFLRLSLLYREMGIKNHSFILSLLNPDLIGIDPFDENLTLEQKAMVAIESKRNFWYYIREVARAPLISGGGDPLQVTANRGNIALWWLYFNHITVLLEQIRQTGKSFSVDQLMIWLLEVRCQNTEINLLTKDDTLRTRNLARLKSIDTALPSYIKRRKKTDVANTEELIISALNNRYKGHLPSKSPKQAQLVGRGLSSGTFHSDESAYTYNIAISLPAALAAGGAAKDIAQMKNEPYGTILTTSAGKKDDPDGAYTYRFAMNSAVWSEVYFDCKDLKDLEKTIAANSPNGNIRIYAPFNHNQLGYTDEWLELKIRQAEAEDDGTGNTDRDFFGRWTSGTTTSPITPEMAEIIRASQVLDYYSEITQPWSYILRWYIPQNSIKARMRSGYQIMSLDTSDAIGRDDIALHIRDVQTGETLAAGNFNETNLITFAEWIVDLIAQYPNMVTIIERRSSGIAIIDLLLLKLVGRSIDPFKRLYNKIASNSDEFPDAFKVINQPMFSRDPEIYTRYKKHFGFATSASGATSRTLLYSVSLLAAVKNTGSLIKDKQMIDQILALEIKNGRVDHPDGEHDDLCIAFLLSYWMLTQSKNMQFYGIDPRLVLQANSVHIKDNAPLDLYAQEEQRILREEIENIVEQIKQERDPFIIQKLEKKLIMMSDKLILNEGEVFSIDQLIKQIQDEKKLNRLTQNVNYPSFGSGNRPAIINRPQQGFNTYPYGGRPFGIN